jgi:hypothetical protein
MRKAFLSVLGLAFVACALMAPVASAANEKLKIREVYPDNGGSGSYVVLQAYAPGQNHLAGKAISWFTQPLTGGSFPGTYTIPSDVSNDANQMTILIGDSGYVGPPAADFTAPGMELWSNNGQFCLDGINCIIWGGGGGAGPTPGVGFPAFEERGIPVGKAMIRSIGLGCPTLLEGRDDTEQGNSDFYTTSPSNPRNNASPIIETPCAPPNTGINSATVEEGETTNSTSVRIAFAASPFPETTYECKLDDGSFLPCVSPVEYTGLGGDETPTGTPHKFEVRAANVNGVEQTPASRSWIVNTNPSLLAAPTEPTSSATTAAPAGAAVAGAAASAAAAPVSAASDGMAAQDRAKPKKKQKLKKRRIRHARQAHP